MNKNLVLNGGWSVSGISASLEGRIELEEPSVMINEKVNYSESIWDFSNHDKKHNKRYCYIYDFTEIKERAYRVILKRLVIRKRFTYGNEFTSVQVTFQDIKKLISYLIKDCYIFSPQFITSSSVNQYVDKKCMHLSSKTKSRTIGNIQFFLNEIESAYPEFKISEFNLSEIRPTAAEWNSQNQNNKTPNIPREILNKIIQCALIDINDDRYDDYISIPEFAKLSEKSEEYLRNKVKTNGFPGAYKGSKIEGWRIPKIYMSHVNKIDEKKLLDELDNMRPPSLIERMTACMIIILSQVGMRRGEAMLLEINKLKEIAIFNNQQKAYYLSFFTYKTSSKKDGRWTESNMNDLAVKAYQKIEELGTARRNGKQYLFCNFNGNSYSPHGFGNQIDNFFVRHQKSLGFDTLNNEQLDMVEKWEISDEDTNIYKDLGKEDLGKTFYKVNPHQFRVSVANGFLKSGVSLQWIRRHMNHLEEEMTKHYFRDDTQVRETLANRAMKDGSLLETNIAKISNQKIKEELSVPELKEAYDTINRFLNKNKLNVHEDLDKIVSLLLETTIRENEMGYCVNAIGRLCEHQERLTTMEKWYFAKIQIADIRHFEFTCKRMLEKVKLVEHNFKICQENDRFQRQYELELQSLRALYENKYKPELDLYLSDLDVNGEEHVHREYPNLEKCHYYIEEIGNGVASWLMN
ncbi:tyrosine-type recombinase/integrase [Paenibacillus alginolyticus]|uniref:Tyrosine-type recombinase/integrase n=1 Tax=Paenibacillus alginolyticus TaxID=59839 RepID=A0ABT4G7P8_9BACL|nr:tyrosine-type recombinase/integrase [Paenibacillus alginolyticus]MCY9692206.1 tyrosine-type recombinase/integrase [Paenibacillus alginolyticus]MEC0145955.1 tyrosine-type recombinase/integrase [Paenibacillus alginolyticus]